MSTTPPSPTAFLEASRGSDLRNRTQLIQEASRKYGVDPELVASVAHTESSMDPNAVSSKGAKGIMQLMPATAEQYGVTNPFNPQENIDGGTQYLSDLIKRYGDKKTAVAAYNWGPDNVDAAKRMYGKDWLSHAPKETQDYVRKVLGEPPSPQDFLASTETGKKTPLTPPPGKGFHLPTVTQAASFVAGTKPEVTEKAYEQMQKPGWKNKLVGGAEYLVSGVPFAGAPLAQAMEEAGEGKYKQSAIHTAEALPQSAFLPVAEEKIVSKIAGDVADQYLPEAAEALRKARTASLTPNYKVALENYIHAGGIEAKHDLAYALGNARQQVGMLAQTVASKVDTAEPEGAIDAAKLTKGAENSWKQIFAIAKKYPGEVEAMFSEPGVAGTPSEAQLLGNASVFQGSPASATAGSVKEMLGRGAGKLQPSENFMRQLQDLAEQGFDKTGFEGTVGGAEKWSFEQAKQLRSQIGRALGRVGDIGDAGARRDLKAALSRIYGQLSDEMQSAAERNGAAREYKAYNDLEKFIDQTLLAKDRPLYKILRRNVTTGKSVAEALEKGGEATRATLTALQKYGLDLDRMEEYMKNYRRFNEYIPKQGGGFYGIISSARKYPIGTIGGIMAAKMFLPSAGYLPYIGGAIGGSQAERSVRARIAAHAAQEKMTPAMLDVIERELGPLTEMIQP